MNILHICNDFFGSKVHANLYKHLDKLGIKQTVFTYYGGTDKRGKNQFETQQTSFLYSGILKTYHHFFYHVKVNRVYEEIISTVKPEEFDVIHAVTLFSDGGVAYKLNKKYHIPYIVAVRSTDVDYFLKFAPHTWLVGISVLRNASKIVFISEALKNKFCNHIVVKSILAEISPKFVVQPNGIDDFWIDRVYKAEKNTSHNIVYVGKFSKTKNTVRLIKAVLSLKDIYQDICLHLVGGDGGQENKVRRLVAEHKDTLKYHGKVFDKNKLMDIYRQCSVFAMPSIHETFGLVYLEALSQNLALVYTLNQGVDGLLDEHVGEKVNALSQSGISGAIQKIIETRSSYLSYEVVDFESYRWSSIAGKYASCYKDVIEYG